MELDLPLIWAAIIAFAVFKYVLMDGFDLGVGILFMAVPADDERDLMMSSVAPIWDGNETWLVLGGGGLLAVFPLAYALLLPALYLPLIAMLIALVFRGVAFEFRFKATRSKWLWNWSFCLGSALATFAQGVVLGSFVQGFEIDGRDYAGGALDWLTPFSMATGLALLAGYGLLGATWLVMKTEGPLQDWSYRVAQRLLVVVIAAMAVISLWVPFLGTSIHERWFSWPNLLYLSPVPALVALAAALLWHSIRKRREYAPFLLSMVLFVLGYAGLAISLWPHIVPPDVTIWQAAAARSTQEIMLVGVAVMMPIILGYTAHSYWVFRGKASVEHGYH